LHSSIDVFSTSFLFSFTDATAVIQLHPLITQDPDILLSYSFKYFCILCCYQWSVNYSMQGILAFDIELMISWHNNMWWHSNVIGVFSEHHLQLSCQVLKYLSWSFYMIFHSLNHIAHIHSKMAKAPFWCIAKVDKS
jgi:hypothetical protein